MNYNNRDNCATDSQINAFLNKSNEPVVFSDEEGIFASQRPGPSRKRTIVEISDDETSSEHLKVKNRRVTDGTLLLAKQSGKGASYLDCVVSETTEPPPVKKTKSQFLVS